MTVTINQKIYQMGPNLFESMVEAAKDKYKKSGQCAIVAVGKGEVWAMDNKVFPSRQSMDNAVKQLKRSGLQVRTVRA